MTFVGGLPKGVRREREHDHAVLCLAFGLADPARAGRGHGTPGINDSCEHIERRFSELGLVGAGDGGSFLKSMSVPTRLTVEAETYHRSHGVSPPHHAIRPLIG